MSAIIDSKGPLSIDLVSLLGFAFHETSVGDMPSIRDEMSQAVSLSVPIAVQWAIIPPSRGLSLGGGKLNVSS
ncbi:hypothetical protein ACQ7HM_13145 [Williamsia sp. MIQD14]|uniref:hypothetical protein n=1 Tax=Williamsia sp. MIQD14 TaxID=3425703 RepID=UPI003DA01259